jgi:6-phosphogluconolactonase/glucosamine-6-phosphate isomerase/deaminase
MICHYYRDLLSKSKPSSSVSTVFAVNKINDKSAADFIETTPHADLTSHSQPRIAIVGGGIAGVTAANALCKKLSSNNVTAKIVIFEGDEYGSNNEVDFSNHQQPSWLAGKSVHHYPSRCMILS